VSASETDLNAGLVQLIAEKRLDLDPLWYCKGFFPWGQGELKDYSGPRMWQADLMTVIGDHLKNSETRFKPLRIAVSSGHGIGKSAGISMLLNWAMSTCDDCRVVVTSNTENQLRTKTWPEVAKWMRLSLTAGWWQVPAMSVYSNEPGREKSWRADATPWSEHNTEAFAGLHNKGKRIVLVFDEASGIADKVWEVAEGALTDEDTEIIWLAFGNPTNATGRFRECFGKHRHLWVTRQIDSRTVEGTNKAYLDEMVKTYGEDSDIVKVRVRGQFPSQSVSQFIGSDVVEAAKAREVELDRGASLVMGVDIARFGDDQCVIRFRRGRDGKCIPPIKWRDRDTHFSANKIAEAIKQYKPDAVFVDGGGVGGGVIDNLRAWGYRPIEVNFGAQAGDSKEYYNKRAEMWGLMKDWLKTGSIDDDAELTDDLVGPQYGFDKDGRIQLEKKEDMKKRGIASPDNGDALALTFARPVARLDLAASLHQARNAVADTGGWEYG
jgi:hypothetical protein